MNAYPSLKNAIFLCLIFLAIQFLISILSAFLLIPLGLSESPDAAGVITILTNTLAAGIVIIFGYKKTGRAIKEVFKLNAVPLRTWLAATVFMAGLVIIISEFDNLFNAILPMPAMLSEIFQSLAENNNAAIAILATGIIPAFTEELFLRGLILDGFSRNYSRRKAIILSALLFGALHANPWQFLSAFCVGIFLAWICINTKSIALCVYIHFFNNTLYVATLRLPPDFPRIQGFNSVTEPGVVLQPLWFDAAGIVLFALGFFLLRVIFKKNNTAPRLF
ncbi:MAG: CPBP family intramembrane metalloprotease [Spirochaetaceae bacterium]|jgi:membrane protease YdiL (CAAX protease family)|nr:CPBP family intramembrane metalloprotease [Spirochaetaceae bacterium]